MNEELSHPASRSRRAGAQQLAVRYLEIGHHSEVRDADRLFVVLDRLRTMLADQGHVRQAAWIADRRRALERDPESVEIRAELHGIVPRMGGLIDLPLQDAKTSAERNALADALYQLTRP